MSAYLIQVRDALCRIGAQKTLRIPQFSLASGQHWCVYGGNGAGKSLFIKLLLGELVTGLAHVHYGDNFSVRDDVLMVSFEQQQKLLALDNRHDISEFNASAQDQGTTVASLILGAKSPSTRYQEILTALGLDGLQERGIRYLSSGQCRRAMLASALFQRPRLLILDEPLESIDLATQGLIKQALADWMSPQTSTLLLCRRAQDILPSITHLALMEDLHLVAQGPISAMRAHPDFLRIMQQRSPLPKRLPSPAAGVFTSRPALDPQAPLIELRDVRAAYNGKVVLDGVSWTMRRGQHVLIEGPNGCGKSTLLSLINGENHMAYGQQVYLFGRRRGSGETVWEVKSYFGVVSNEIHNRYVKGWRVLDVVVSGFFDSIGLYDDSGASEQGAALEWLRAFGIDDLYRDYFHTLSFGQQRLVLLARAMVKHPSILILDEACVGLDDEYRELILGIIDMIAMCGETHIIFVSHSQGEAPSCINQTLSFTGQGIDIKEH